MTVGSEVGRIASDRLDRRTIGATIGDVMRLFRSQSRSAPSPVGPTFILLGANKGGTTSLWKYLDQHPDVYMSRVKEPMYFTSIPEQSKGGANDRWRANAVRTWPEYVKLFEPGRAFSARGEASTGYLRNEQAPARIHDELPNVQLAAILRNPFDRALSHYKMYQRLDMEALTFSEAIEAELNQPRNVSMHDRRIYLRMGFYGGSITRYLEYFSQDQLKIYLYEDLETKPMDLMADLYQHVGVDPTFVCDTSTRFNAAPVGTVPEWDADLLGRYLELLEPDLQLVEQLIDRDLASWRRPSSSPA